LLVMKMLTRLAIIATCGLAAFLFLFAHVGKALTNQGDLTMWSPPFSHRVILVPDWMWPATILAATAGPLLLLVLWGAVGLRNWKARKRFN
jgi:integral membrane sensor domain MASE1